MQSRGKRAPKVFAVDPSLTCSGWALFIAEVHGPIAVGTLSPPGPKLSMPQRMSRLQIAVEQLFDEVELEENDVLICEGPAPLVLNPQSSLKVEGVRGLFETVARARGLRVPGRINPRTIQSELLGMSGKQLPRTQVKDWARAAAMRLYEKELGDLRPGHIPQDIIDAVLLGSYVMTRIALAAKTGADLEDAIQPRSAGRGYSGRRRGSGWTPAQMKMVAGLKR